MAEPSSLVERDDSNMKKFSKPARLSLHLIVRRHLPPGATGWSQEKIIEELNKIRRVRLDRENIGEIDSMELLSSEVSNLYLQCNRIQRIENLECLLNLQVLVLSQNQIEVIEGISHLQRLVFLDLSDNDIVQVDPESFPCSIVILDLRKNPCARAEHHREKLMRSLPKLKQLDDVKFDNEDNSESDDSESEQDLYGEDREEAHSFEEESNEETPLHIESPYRQLPKIEMSIPDITTEMLIRSQERLENRNVQHKRLLQEMTNIKIKTKIMPLPEIKRET